MSLQTLARRRPDQKLRTFSTAVAGRPLHLSLPKRSRGVARRAGTSAATRGPATQADRITPAKLEAVEDRLLADTLDQHPQYETALDGALEDMAILSAELRRSRRRPLLLRSATNLNRVEDLLLEAMLRAHPNREAALDHLLDDVMGGDAVADTEHARAAFDMQVDNDFDGLS